MMRIIYFFLLMVCIFKKACPQQFTVSGTVTDSASGEQVIGALVYIKATTKAVSTNAYGYFSLLLDKGDYELACNALGYKTVAKQVKLDKNTVLNFKVAQLHGMLEEVSVLSDKDVQSEQIHSTEMGAITIPIEQIRNIPTIGGETDIIKVIQLMPGIKRGGDGQNAMLVRGGNGDDNLLLLDEAVVYNVNHLFGFFSVFNNDALKEVTVYKGGFPARYGGRLSSVMDIRMKEGNMKKFAVKGGIGLLSSHLTVEGPVVKDKLSFLVSARRSYIDKVMKAAYQEDVLPYYFYDLNYKLNYIIGPKDRLYLSGYYGNDVLTSPKSEGITSDKLSFTLGNMTHSLRWNHIYSPKLFSNVSLIYTRFRYDVRAGYDGGAFAARSRIEDIGATVNYNYYLNPENTMTFGAYYTNHLFRPNVVSTSGEIADYVASREGKRIFTNDFGAYIANDWKIDTAFKVNYGLRLSMLETQGVIYKGLEPRLSATYSINKKNSVKLGYSRMQQYIHLVSSSSVSLPTDLWYPVTKQVKPLSSDQVALSYNRLFKKLESTLTVEAYYKWINNMIEYREGSNLILNDNYEDALVKGSGRAYGVEFFFSRTKGKFTGWIGYSISWAHRRFAELNRGQEYYAKFDRRHDLSVVANYNLTKRFSVSGVFVYSSGQRFTPIVGSYFAPNSSFSKIDLIPIYGDKNSVSFPASTRFDISLVFKTRENRKFLRYEGEWHIGAYNLFNQAQPNRVKIVSNGNSGYKYQATGLFGCIPFIAYHFSF